jgi:hypothetical protein
VSRRLNLHEREFSCNDVTRTIESSKDIVGETVIVLRNTFEDGDVTLDDDDNVTDAAKAALDEVLIRLYTGTKSDFSLGFHRFIEHKVVHKFSLLKLTFPVSGIPKPKKGTEMPPAGDKFNSKC